MIKLIYILPRLPKEREMDLNITLSKMLDEQVEIAYRKDDLYWILSKLSRIVVIVSIEIITIINIIIIIFTNMIITIIMNR